MALRVRPALRDGWQIWRRAELLSLGQIASKGSGTKMKATIHSLVLSASTMGSSLVASAAVIDDFSQGPLSFQVTNVSGQIIYQTGLSTSDVLGGARSVYAGSLIQATAVIDTSAREFRFSSDSSFGYFTLTEGGAFPPSGTDLTADGSDAFAINITQLTIKPVRGIFDFEVETLGAWYGYDLQNDFNGLNGFGTVTIPFSSFPGVDMRYVQAVRINAVRFKPSSQIVIGSITTVPEPSALSLFSGAFVVLTFLRRCRERHNNSAEHRQSSRKMTLSLNNQCHLVAAADWLGLGDWQSANNELEQITPDVRSHPSVLSVRYEVYSRAKKWVGTSEVARTLVEALPERPEFWIALVYSTRRKPGGGIPQARELLTEARMRFPDE
jgi:hypothetical protein